MISFGFSFNINIVFFQQIINAINPEYTKLLVDEQVTFTDVLVWAILVDRVELAKAVS